MGVPIEMKERQAAKISDLIDSLNAELLLADDLELVVKLEILGEHIEMTKLRPAQISARIYTIVKGRCPGK